MAASNMAAMREALVAVKDGVYTGAYGNRFAVVKVNLGGYRFIIHADQGGFCPRIKVMDQKEVLNRVMDELVDCINKGAAAAAASPALSAPARNCDRFSKWHEAWDAFVAEYGGPTDPGETEYYFGVWLFAKAEGGAE